MTLFMPSISLFETKKNFASFLKSANLTKTYTGIRHFHKNNLKCRPLDVCEQTVINQSVSMQIIYFS